MAVIDVRVTPRASRDAVEPAGAHGVIRVRVTAPPVDGAANAAVVRALAKALGLPSRDVVLVAGERGRDKRFAVPLPAGEVEERLRAGAGDRTRGRR